MQKKAAKQVATRGGNSWNELNATLKGVTDEKLCAEMLEAERAGKRRLMNVLRAARERKELMRLAGQETIAPSQPQLQE
jgi:hypothetical protein